MAIVKMKKVTVVALNDDKGRLVSDLMWLSAVDITPLGERLKQDGLSQLASIDSASESEAEYAGRIDIISSAEKILKPLSVKKGLFVPRERLTREEFDSYDPDKTGVTALADDSVRIKNELGEVRNGINRLETLREQLKAWLPLSIPLERKISKKTSVVYGTFSTKTNAAEGFGDRGLSVWYEELYRDKSRVYSVMIYLDSQEKQLMSYLADNEFSRMTFPGLEGTPAYNLKKTETELEELNDKKDALEAQLLSYAQRYFELEKAEDILDNRKKLCAVRDRFLVTDTAFVLEGWCPVDKEEELDRMCEKYDCALFKEDPADDEEPPIKLKNNRFVAPFENITSMYALPHYRGIDPNFIVAPFYFLLFGIMLSDAGIGLLMTVGCFLAIKYLHPKPGMKSSLEMFMYCGISTVFWGFMFGTFFGDSFGTVASTFFGSDFYLKPVMFDPVSNPLALLYISFAIGYIQVLTGVVLKGWILIRDRHYLDALFDVGFWILVLVGLPVFAGGMIFSLPVMSEIGKYMCLAGALGLIATQGRNEKNIIKKISSGVMSLYGITNYFADILSYSRILALGLSAGVIGSVFNKLGTLLGGGILGAVFFIIVFIVGHSLNAALSSLSAYVHASRLQFIEFFSKFYEGGGRPYEAFKAEGKYTDVY